jgi:FemAB-related protein (PEP-CTERM system-associated)
VTEALTSPALRIRVATDRDAGRWNEFLNLCPRANFYQRYEWEQANRVLLGHRTLFLLCEQGDRIVGVLPLVNIRSRLFGNVLTSMPFVNFGGPAAHHDAIEEILVREACAHADRHRGRYLEVRSTRPLAGLLQRTDKVSMTIALKDDPEQMMAAFSQKHRHNIRRAQKAGFEVRTGGAELLDDFFDILSFSWHALGTPLYRKSYFAGLLRAFGTDLRVYVAYHEGRPVATALNGFFKDTVEGMWAGVDPRHAELQPNYVLYWEMIADACRSGYRQYHLGRSTKDSGAQRFKEKWLGEPKQLYWNYHLVTDEEMPHLSPSNPQFDRAIRTWRRMPLAVLRVIGPPIARLIP